MTTARPPRIALLGLVLESNAFAPVATESDFRARTYVEGEALLEAARAPVSSLPTEMSAFVRAMDATGPWEPLPVILTGCPPWGPVDHAFFERTVAAMVERLRAAGSVDGVYVANHGAMVSTETPDPDGEMLARIRAAVGPAAAIVGTLDLHANLSERMVESASVLIGYQTNPHVDMLERGEEAAFTMRRLLAGMRPHPVLVRLPIVAPSVTLLTREGPYADLIDLGQRRQRELAGAVLNVTVLGGFAFGDTPKNGLAILVTARDDPAPARALARELAERAWAERARFRKRLTAIEDAVAIARAAADDPASPAHILADSGDNPGGGGSGNTTALLAALVESGVRGVLFGSMFDRELAMQAHRLGVGARFEAVFNREPWSEFSPRLALPARVVALGDGRFVGRRGIYAGRAVDLGPSCALALGPEEGVTAVVISRRLQTADPLFFEHLGLDPGAARTVCVKSWGTSGPGSTSGSAPTG